jgi:hypothetical protein
MDEDFWVDFQEIMHEKNLKINLYESGNELFFYCTAWFNPITR